MMTTLIQEKTVQLELTKHEALGIGTWFTIWLTKGSGKQYKVITRFEISAKESKEIIQKLKA